MTEFRPFTDLDKGVGASGRPWNLLAGDVSYPAAVLHDRQVAHNLEWMRQFTEAYGVRLAPHGKTTMIPSLFQRQLDAGAWGMTVATSQQARVAARQGVERILIANQLVGAANIAAILDLIAGGGVEILCLVDSVAGVDLLGAACAARGVTLPVLIELAPAPDQPAFRTGIRDRAGLTAVLDALDRWQGHVMLAGVEFYEGVLTTEAEIRRFVGRAVDVFERLRTEGRIGRSPAILSGAGSAWYDVVAEESAGLAALPDVEIVLRPGCYISHDSGLYRAAQTEIRARNPVAASLREGLLPALQVWACVQSIPDPARAVIAMGKRDVAFDAGLPIPATLFRAGRDQAPVGTPPHWTVTGLMDQHAYLAIAPGDDIAVGDVIAFDISHPCLTFDKWRHILLVDERFECVAVLPTYF